MSVHRDRLAMLCVLLMVAAGCRQQPLPVEPDALGDIPATGNRPVPTLGPDDALPAVAGHAPSSMPAPEPAGFDLARVPESRATLPPFPLLQSPAGLRGLYGPAERDIAFDREHMIAGDAVIALEGKVFRQRYLLDGGERAYSEFEFHRNHADAIAALGGVEVSAGQYTPAVNRAFGGRAAVDRHYHGTCASHGCENHTYLVRQRGQEYWVQVSTGGVPPHGQVTVLQRPAVAAR